MECKTRKEGGALIVAVVGRLDSTTTPEFEEQCSAWINDGETKLVLDFSDLDYISSAGLRAVLWASKQLKTREGALALCNVQKNVQDVFEIAGFASFLPLCADVEEALKGL